jgi:hypothetical protein
MPDAETFYDQIIKQLKNNKLVALVLLACAGTSGWEWRSRNWLTNSMWIIS